MSGNKRPPTNASSSLKSDVKSKSSSGRGTSGRASGGSNKPSRINKADLEEDSNSNSLDGLPAQTTSNNINSNLNCLENSDLYDAN